MLTSIDSLYSTYFPSHLLVGISERRIGPPWLGTIPRDLRLEVEVKEGCPSLCLKDLRAGRLGWTQWDKEAEL